MCHTALGTDTGGSIRQPAAFCGVVGLKPTYGVVSRYGLVAYASSFDTIGPIAASVSDAARVFWAIAGRDEHDGTSVDPAERAPGGPSGDVGGLRIGLPEDYLGEGLAEPISDAVRAAAARLSTRGAQIVDVRLPRTEYGISAYYVLATAEASSNLARYDGIRYGRRRYGPDGGRNASTATLSDLYVWTRSDGFGEEVKRRIMLGTYVLSSGYYDAYYDKASRVRRLIREDFDAAFREVDLLLAPTTPGTAFRLGEKTKDPLQMYLSDVYTVTANLAGIPAISVPFGADPEGLPIGVQLLAPAFGERRLFEAAAAIEGLQNED
jgi:aspartyl-tRNA(Asn)/glutamyl-tRNA(Gln) amidotransferase subunit A